MTELFFRALLIIRQEIIAPVRDAPLFLLSLVLLALPLQLFLGGRLEPTLVVLLFFFCLVYQVDTSVSFGLGVVLLVGCAVSLSVGWEGLAEVLAVWTYYSLVVGVLLQTVFLFLVQEHRSKFFSPPPMQRGQQKFFDGVQPSFFAAGRSVPVQQRFTALSPRRRGVPDKDDGEVEESDFCDDNHDHREVLPYRLGKAAVADHRFDAIIWLLNGILLVGNMLYFAHLTLFSQVV